VNLKVLAQPTRKLECSTLSWFIAQQVSIDRAQYLLVSGVNMEFRY